jgi:hypothetical protein
VKGPTPVFRFDGINHEYIDLATGAVLPHITGMLERTGWIDDTWFTEESSARGQAVHRLTADYDLGALDVKSCVSKFRGYLLGHVKALQILQPEILAVEEPLIHPVYRFGGRPDRVVIVRRVKGVLEIKSGAVEKSHQIQTALQAMLASPETDLPPEMLQRLCLYLKDNGKFKLEEHTHRRDFDEARRIIRTCCGS